MHLPCTESTASNSMPSGKRHVTEILTWQRPCEVVHISGVQSSQRHTLQINIKTLAHMLLATLNVAQPVAISQTEWITSFRNYLQPLNCTPTCMHRHTKFLFNWPSLTETSKQNLLGQLEMIVILIGQIPIPSSSEQCWSGTVKHLVKNRLQHYNATKTTQSNMTH